MFRDLALVASRSDAEHDARLDAEELAEDEAAFLAWADRTAPGGMVTDYPHADGCF
jgi:hypothetical protein